MKEKISYDEQKQIELDNFFRKKDLERHREMQWSEYYADDHISLFATEDELKKKIKVVYTEHDKAIWKAAFEKERSLWRLSTKAFDSYVRKNGATKEESRQAHWNWNVAYQELKEIEEIHGQHKA